MSYLYHYTDRLTLADIRREGKIRAHPLELSRDMLRQGPSYTTAPIVWLTSNPILELTVVGKMIATGWPQTLIGDIGRIVLPAGYAGDIRLGEYTEAVGIDPGWWLWVIRTGDLAGSHYSTWRVVDRDIPAADWLRVEILAGFGESDTRWEILM